MPAYWIVRMNVTNAEPYEEYKKRTPAALAKYGGRFLARGGRVEVLEGDVPPARIVLIEFPSFEQAVACYRSPEYREAKHFREGAADAQIVVVEGLQ
ncbi:MAG: DUF1330 domain-containing protein [Acidiferrobacterales bacterium]